MSLSDVRKRRFKTSVKVEERLWRRFKSACALNGVDMCVQMETLIKAWLADKEKREP